MAFPIPTIFKTSFCNRLFGTRVSKKPRICNITPMTMRLVCKVCQCVCSRLLSSCLTAVAIGAQWLQIAGMIRSSEAQPFISDLLPPLVKQRHNVIYLCFRWYLVTAMCTLVIIRTQYGHNIIRRQLTSLHRLHNASSCHKTHQVLYTDRFVLTPVSQTPASVCRRKNYHSKNTH